MQPNLTLLVKHQYDALNRLVATTPTTQAASQRFYLKDRLVTEIQGTEQRSIMQYDDQLLAQQQHQSGTAETRLLATDPQRSVLNVLDATRPHPLAYTPYGHRPLGNGLLSLLGFNGERPDPVTGWYLLGTGYHRPFNPVLMRFTSPDSWSPFGEGGVNAYAYCVGDPVNRTDPTGHLPNAIKPLLRTLGIIKKPTKPATKQVTQLIPATSINTKNSSYELVGFHGTSADYALGIEKNGLDPKFIKEGHFGMGFYTTPHSDKAKLYSGVKPGTFDKDPNGMLAIYVKNPTNKIDGQDFSFHPGKVGALDELRILPKMYSDVKAIRFHTSWSTQTPDIKEIFNIQSEIRSTSQRS